MTILDIIAALIAAVGRNDTTTSARLLDMLDERLPIEEQLVFLEAIFGEEPVAHGRFRTASSGPAACA